LNITPTLSESEEDKAAEDESSLTEEDRRLEYERGQPETEVDWVLIFCE